MGESEIQPYFEIIREMMHRVEFQKADIGRESECVFSEIPFHAFPLSKVIASHACVDVGYRSLTLWGRPSPTFL